MKSRKLTMVLFIFYLLVLSWIVLFKTRFAFAFLDLRFSFVSLDVGRSINLIPFGGMLFLNGAPSYNEVIYNALAFLPFGIFICMLRKKRSFASLILPIFLTSLLFEVLQYVFAIGASDITDLIANSAGGIIGAGIFYVMSQIFNENVNRIINTIAMVIVIGFGLFICAIRPL
jgi:glycopeptide antibiotics resistance protein